MRNTLVFLLFFFSGAAGLIYEVTWARSLGLVFGASHLAVTTVLAAYMGGQALGSAVFGGAADRTKRPLQLYGWIELGIAASAIGFLGLMSVYPWVYPPVARLAGDSGAWLTTLRAAFAVVAMIIPTTLMGGTLPVLARFVAGKNVGTARRLANLYAINTIGAVAGTLAAGFFLIPSLGVAKTMITACAISAVVGIGALLARESSQVQPSREGSPADESVRQEERAIPGRALKATLVGIAVSGFCALGYEVLWTRMLTLVLGTSVYSFSIMLVAFLTGIGAGSFAFRHFERWGGTARSAALLFAVIQVGIGLSALAVTLAMGFLPSIANTLRDLFEWKAATEFTGRLVASFAVGAFFMVVPAFLMGLAFPVAAAVGSPRKEAVGSTVGRMLTMNTIGAILGSIVSGFFLIRWFGIERSLQLLVLLNVGNGLLVASTLFHRRWITGLVAAATAGVAVVRVVLPDWGRAWDQKYFATYVNVGRSKDTPEEARRRFADVEVLYFHEGTNETVSVTRSIGHDQAFVVNGRPEASTVPVDVQLQKALGHVPMLLHPAPRKVFVLGTGTGMTLGATAIHPEARRIVLAEIEEGVLGVARTFSRWNRNVLDDPKLEVVFNDGRNYLATTREKFDVITADPIHPWSGGAGYLYTKEYFRSVAEHLEQGGVAAQWLPLYELSVEDVKTVLRTFASSFPHAMVFLTYYDAILVGSNQPIVLDEKSIASRLGVDSVREDLAIAEMASAEALLSFFLMGSDGARSFGGGAPLNTDDNVVLEFNAPRSHGVPLLAARNVEALAAARESILPYLVPEPAGPARDAQVARWTAKDETGRIFGALHALFLANRNGAVVERLAAEMQARDPEYAPFKFLLSERRFHERTQPAQVGSAEFRALDGYGRPGLVRMSVVRQYVGRGGVLVSLVDNDRRKIYGQSYVHGDYAELDAKVRRFSDELLASVTGAAAGIPVREGEVPRHADLTAAFAQVAAVRMGATPPGAEQGTRSSTQRDVQVGGQ